MEAKKRRLKPKMAPRLKVRHPSSSKLLKKRSTPSPPAEPTRKSVTELVDSLFNGGPSAPSTRQKAAQKAAMSIHAATRRSSLRTVPEPEMSDEEITDISVSAGASSRGPKGKQKRLRSVKVVQIQRVILVPHPLSKDTIPKPSNLDIEHWRRHGLVTTSGSETPLSFPSDNTFEAMDSWVKATLPEPFKILVIEADKRQFSNPLWQLLLQSGRQLGLTAAIAPSAADFNALVSGRAIAKRDIYLAPTIPFPKSALTEWGIATESNETESDGSDSNDSDAKADRSTIRPRKRKAKDDSSDSDDASAVPPIGRKENVKSRQQCRPRKVLRVQTPIEISDTEDLSHHESGDAVEPESHADDELNDVFHGVPSIPAIATIESNPPVTPSSPFTSLASEIPNPNSEASFKPGFTSQRSFPQLSPCSPSKNPWINFQTYRI
ncbi:hypothetical protein FRC03_011021 [Tulasnella sp. 419]|nr:hypothetical protein FRC03_011021 [Tulasnella sp. 419]